MFQLSKANRNSPSRTCPWGESRSTLFRMATICSRSFRLGLTNPPIRQALPANLLKRRSGAGRFADVVVRAHQAALHHSEERLDRVAVRTASDEIALARVFLAGMVRHFVAPESAAKVPVVVRAGRLHGSCPRDW